MRDSIYDKPWFLYIAECRDKTLYVGIARDADRRIEDHNQTNRCRYTRYRKPLKLVYKELCENHNTARKRELKIKRFSRSKKLKLVEAYKEDPSALGIYDGASGRFVSPD
jgi:putative endonuclease